MQNFSLIDISVVAFWIFPPSFRRKAQVRATHINRRFALPEYEIGLIIFSPAG